MPRPPAPVHYLRPNERCWTPPAVIFLDTESVTMHRDGLPCPIAAAPGGGHLVAEIDCPADHVEALRLWAATYTDRRTKKRTTARHLSGWGHTAAELVAWLGGVTRNRDTVWLYCHNLGFDLTTTRLPVELVRDGWAITDAAIGGKAPWIRMHRRTCNLAMLDSWSWLPTSLEAIGEAVRVPKRPLPASADDESAWLSRCGWDVHVLATAVLTLMAWWDESELGNWTISGAACGWNAYRHKETAQPIVVDPDPVKVKRERAYVHGGRRGTWQIGVRNAGPFYELDLVAAYPTAAAMLPHPIARTHTFEGMPNDHPNVTSERWGITANVEIRTDTARWPVRIDGATWYPVGHFRADLAGPDIAEAYRLGSLLSIGAGQTHKLGFNMAPWANWCIDVQNGAIEGTPAVARIAAKSWGRSVIGKWAAHGFEREKFGPAPRTGWGYEEGWDHASGSRGGWVDLAGQRWWVSSAGDPDNAYPGILAWVESLVRVRLGRIIDAIGERAVLQCDTDGLIVAGRLVGTKAAHGHLVAPGDVVGQARLQWVLNCLNPVTAPLELRVKNRVRHVQIDGPQHVTTDGQRRFAGLSRHALLGEDGAFRARAWPTLQWQLAHSSPAGYVRPLQTTRIKGPYPTGWILEDKSVVPVETSLNESGETRITPWHNTRYALSGMHRADVQHPILDRLI